jgi:CDP-diglyceride synthetase
MHPLRIAQSLYLLMLANGTPLVAKKLLGERLAAPLDGGIVLGDGRRLFGPSKTVRGILLAVAATAAGALLLNLDWRLGALSGALAMIGDLASSFLKRRLGLAASSRALGLDQLPESLLPLLACALWLGLGFADVVAAAAIFFVGELALSRLFFALHLRDRPY